jgi:hypothetical protein
LNFMENTKELILVHAKMQAVPAVPVEGVNVMLTPQFYTLKREAVPVKYAYQAKRIAPSLFDGLVEDLEEQKYFVFREGEDWVFIAYDEGKIKAFLESKGISGVQVAKIYFAQQAKDGFTVPVLLGASEALVNLDGTMTVVPQAVLADDVRTTTKLSKDIAPKKGITFEGQGISLLSNTEAYTLAAIFALFAIIYFVEGSRYSGDNKAQQEEMATLLEEYPSLQSSYTRESIISKYRAIDSLERKKRDVIKALSRMIFKGSTLTQLSIEGNRFQALFSCADKSTSNKLKELAKKEKFNTSNIATSNDLKIEGTL